MELSTRAKIIASIVVLAALWGIHEYDKAKAVNAVETKYELVMNQSKERSERATKALESSLRKDLEEKNAKISSINSQLADTIKRLRERPVRPNVVTVTEIREACTGAQLYREDGEFLAREAARAERVREERDFFWNKYEEARLKLEELND
jgi:hypothetical protein